MATNFRSRRGLASWTGGERVTAPQGQPDWALQTPQIEPIPGSNQIRDSAGGYSFAVDDWARLDRFLVLGAEGGSYYAGERALTIENAQNARRCLTLDGGRAVRRIVEVSEAGRAPRNDPAIFLLALAASVGDAATRAAALAALPRVCRTGTHLFQFAQFVQSFRGWGRALRRGVAAWYTQQDVRQLSYQLAKYQQRDGWSHRDLLRLTHPRVAPDSPASAALAWVVGKFDVSAEPMDGPLAPLRALEEARKATTAGEIVRLVRDHGLVRECVPTRWLGEPAVWEALLERMPVAALVRNLATMTRIGLLAPGSAGTAKVVGQLGDAARLIRARLHPVAVLLALRTYAAGHGERGRHTWTPVPEIIDALDGAFYAAFGGVVPTGKRWLIGVDVSGSMSALVAGTPLSCCEAATAMALVTAHAESNCAIHAFADRFQPLPISRRTRLDEALRHTRNANFGGTDCALPMLHALERRLPVDGFVVLTDSETWAGAVHPVQALRQYRQRMGIAARLIVVGMVSNGFSIADPADRGMLDVVGFDTAVPQLIGDFVRD
jgi:60 kDa SS-A/Ro ribonucleoprotein